MNITIFGATGRVGRALVQYALADGHQVTALVRSPEKLNSHERLTIIEGDARDQTAIQMSLREADVALSSLCANQTTTLSESIVHITQAMEDQSIRRIVTIGTAGILQSRTEPKKLRYRSNESRRLITFAAEEHEKVYKHLQATTLDWTIVCPTYLPDGPATQTYRVEPEVLPLDGRSISVGDTAHFAYRELTKKTYNQMRVGLSY
ncbi:hypothetical protein BEP19_03400 [Ammoniphilus oxalaticus]|uniref:NAD(P)-binding domain-containing protein n=1 Tax=Ammoniphilus oxalaticus TaxID=66863 RepID=A0A419SNV6_9BACL|nr:SDR family oxidoreductase [Ammoniphilus oxalaticus]RKD25984.1 hypothetical protein BEP19_03400 [Ammoniphilus oxalaticus]